MPFESNLLRFPLFALHTKGLRAFEGIKCRGTTTRGGETYQCLFQTFRSPKLHYPGPLARTIHAAFLSQISEGSLPFENPLTWTWRDLCRRIGGTYSGRWVRQAKRAILSTVGVSIFSEDALYSKAEGRLVRTGESAMHLYERAVFQRERLPGDGVAEGNSLWLAGWYLDNLNALHTAPLDYDLWRVLEGRSSIASRLYEYLLFALYERRELRITYPVLAQYIPVAAHRYYSDAERQLAGPFRLLREAGLVREVGWEPRGGNGQVALLRIVPGQSLFTPGVAGAVSKVQETQLPLSEPSAEGRLVVEFFKQFHGREGHRPNAKELGQAKEIMTRYGEETIWAIFPAVLRRARESKEYPKQFTGFLWFVPEAVSHHEREKRRNERSRLEQAQRQEESRLAQLTKEEERYGEFLWGRLRPEEQQLVLNDVTKNRMDQATNPLVKSRAYHLLAKRSASYYRIIAALNRGEWEDEEEHARWLRFVAEVRDGTRPPAIDHDEPMDEKAVINILPWNRRNSLEPVRSTPAHELAPEEISA